MIVWLELVDVLQMLKTGWVIDISWAVNIINLPSNPILCEGGWRNTRREKVTEPVCCR